MTVSSILLQSRRVKLETKKAANDKPMLSHTEHLYDDVTEVKDYYLNRRPAHKYYEQQAREPQHHCASKAEPLPHLHSADSKDFDIGHIERWIHIQDKIDMDYHSWKERFRNAENESLSSDQGSEEQLSIPDYAQTDKKALDALMRFGMHSSRDGSDHHTDPDEITIPEYADVDRNGSDEIMRFGQFDKSDDSDDREANHPMDTLREESTGIDFNLRDSANFKVPQPAKGSSAMELLAQNHHETDTSTIQNEREERFDSFSTDSSLVIVYMGPRFQRTPYEFGEIETLDSDEESERLGGNFSGSESENSDSAMVQRHEDQRFNACSSVESTVVFLTGKRSLQTFYEFGEVETLDSDEKEIRSLIIPESNNSDVEVCSNSFKPTVRTACEDSRSNETRSCHGSADLRERDVEVEIEYANEMAGEEIKMSMIGSAETKDVHDGEWNTHLEPSMESEWDETEPLPRNPSASSSVFHHKPWPRVRRKRDILKRVARFFRKYFGKTIA